MIRINNLLFKYNEKAGFRIKINDLKIDDSERCCIVGPSGSGKTTLINIITGIYKPLSGTVSIDDLEINNKNDNEIREFRIRNIGYIFQDFGLIDYLNVEDNVLLPFYLSPKIQVDEAVYERAGLILKRLGLEGKGKRYTTRLSQGEKQRVAIARALVTNPKIIIGDETTSNVDRKTAENIMNLLLDVVEETKATFLFVTHNLSLTKYFKRTIDLDELNK